MLAQRAKPSMTQDIEPSRMGLPDPLHLGAPIAPCRNQCVCRVSLTFASLAATSHAALSSLYFDLWRRKQ